MLDSSLKKGKQPKKSFTTDYDHNQKMTILKIIDAEMFPFLLVDTKTGATRKISRTKNNGIQMT